MVLESHSYIPAAAEVAMWIVPHSVEKNDSSRSVKALSEYTITETGRVL